MANFLNYIKTGDAKVFLLFNRRLHCQTMDVVMQFFTQLGSLMFAVFLPLMLYFTGRKDLIDLAFRLTAILIISQIIVHLVKWSVNRQRPFRVLENAIAKRPPTSKRSFPSGHTTAAFSLAFVLASSIPALGVFFFSMASLVGLSRVYLGAHYPTDVIVGYITAYASFLLHARFFFG